MSEPAALSFRTRGPGTVAFDPAMTASLTHSRHRYTYHQYLAFERDSELKHEYADGEIYATFQRPAPTSAVAPAAEGGERL